MGEESQPQRLGPSYVAVAIGAVVNVLAHAVLLFGFLIVLVWVVPRFRETFAEMQAELPALTVALMRLSGLCELYWYVLLLGFILFLGLDAVLFSFLAGRQRTWILALLWSVALTAFLGVGEVVLLVGGLHAPLVRLMADLGKGT